MIRYVCIEHHFLYVGKELVMNKMVAIVIPMVSICFNLFSLELQITLTDNFRSHPGKYEFRFSGGKEHKKTFVLDIRDKTVTIATEETKKENPNEDLNITINGGVVTLKTSGCYNELKVKPQDGDLVGKVARSVPPTCERRISHPRGCRGHKWTVDIDAQNEMIATLTHW